MAKKMRPLWTPGGRGSPRPPGLPSLVNGQPANAGVWLEDFCTNTVGTATTPGHPQWVATALGAGGSVGCQTNASTMGTLLLAPSSGAGDGFIVDAGGRTTTSNGTIAMGNTLESLLMWRVAFSGSSSNKDSGFGLLPSGLAIGTNWVADPDTTLATSNALVITQHYTSGYSGDTAGDVVARLYSTGGTDNNSLLLRAAASDTTAYTKFEVKYTGAAFQFWVNGAYIGAMASTVLPALLVTSLATFRPSFGIVAQSAAKTLGCDCYYQEQGFASAR